MLCIQTTSLFTDPKRMRFNDDSYYLRSEAEMRALFDPICPEAITNTVKLAARCDVKLKDKSFHLPHFQRPARFADDSRSREPELRQSNAPKPCFRLAPPSRRTVECGTSSPWP